MTQKPDNQQAKVTLRYSETYGDCETCGSNTYATLVIKRNGEMVKELHGDDHTGGGLYALQDGVACAKLVLQALGYEVDIEEETHD